MLFKSQMVPKIHDSNKIRIFLRDVDVNCTDTSHNLVDYFHTAPTQFVEFYTRDKEPETINSYSFIQYL